MPNTATPPKRHDRAPHPEHGLPGDAVAAWAEARTTDLAGGSVQWDVPVYGSAQWLALPPHDPRRYAAVIEAAELWRRQQAEEQRLDDLADDDPIAWFRETTAEADDQARQLAGRLARLRTADQVRAARTHRPPHQMRATPGWPPIAIPGRPGQYLHPPQQQRAA